MQDQKCRGENAGPENAGLEFAGLENIGPGKQNKFHIYARITDTILISTHNELVFTTLHVMQTRYSEENSVRLSVCLSVRHTRAL